MATRTRTCALNPRKTCGFYAGLGTGTGTGSHIWTRQKPVPIVPGQGFYRLREPPIVFDPEPAPLLHQSPSPTLITHLPPSPDHEGHGVTHATRGPRVCERTATPAISVPFARTHRIPPPLPTAVSHGTPITEPRRLGFGFRPDLAPPTSRLAPTRGLPMDGYGYSQPPGTMDLTRMKTRTRQEGMGFRGYGYGYSQKNPGVTRAIHYRSLPFNSR